MLQNSFRYGRQTVSAPTKGYWWWVSTEQLVKTYVDTILLTFGIPTQVLLSRSARSFTSTNLSPRATQAASIRSALTIAQVCTGLSHCNPTCSYSASSACLSTSYYTKITCECSGNFYATADGCISCPTNSVNATGIVDRCSCEAGLYWSRGHCLPCPAYKYSAANSVNCTQCPNGATSTPGSSNCVCFPGLHKEGTECRECGGNTFSVRNTTSCTDCPENSTASLDHSACECQGNYLWNPASNNCTEKEKQHSEEPSTNMTTTVLSNNTAQPLTTDKNITQNNKQTPAPQTPDKKT